MLGPSYASPTHLPFCLQSLISGEYQIGFVGVSIVFSQQRNPLKMPRECHKTTGSAPLWLGMKGQMIPVCPSVCLGVHNY